MSLLRIFTLAFLALEGATASAKTCSTASCYKFLANETYQDNVDLNCRARQHVEVYPCTVTTTTTITEFTETDTIVSTTTSSNAAPQITSGPAGFQQDAAALSCPYTSRTSGVPRAYTKSCNDAEFVTACECRGFYLVTNTSSTATATVTESAGAHTTTTSTTTTLVITSCPPSSTTIDLGPVEPTTITDTITSTKTLLRTSTNTVSKTVTSKYSGTTTVTAGLLTSVVTATTVPTVHTTATVTDTSTLTLTSTVITVTSIYISSETTYQTTTTYMQSLVPNNTCYIQEFYTFDQSTAIKTQTVKSTVNITKTSIKSLIHTSSLYSAKSTTTVPLVTSTSYVTPSVYTQTDLVTKSVNATLTTTSTVTNVSQYESFATIAVPPCDVTYITCIRNRVFHTLCQLYLQYNDPQPPTILYPNTSEWEICQNYCADNPQCGYWQWDSTTGLCTAYKTFNDPPLESSGNPQIVIGGWYGQNCTS